MAGKYNLFLVLWFAVACFGTISTTVGVSSTAATTTTQTAGNVNSTTVTTTAGNVTSTAATTTTPTAGNVTSTAVTTTPTAGNVTSTAATTTTPTAGNVTSTTVTTTTPTAGNVTSTTVTTTTPTAGNVTSTTVTTTTPTAGNVTSTTVTTTTPTAGNVTSTTVTTTTPTAGNVTSTAATTTTPTAGNVTSTAATTTTPTAGNVTSTAATTTTPTAGNVTSTAATTTTPTAGNVTSTTVTTEPPGSGGPFTTPISPATATRPPPTTAPDPCHMNPCGRGSTCAVRANQTFVCLCLLGDSYNYLAKVCVNARVFPGQLSLPNLIYNENMQNKESPEFKAAAQNITCELSSAFDTKYEGFSNVTVLSLQKLAQSRVGSVRVDRVTASIELIFSTNSTITTSEITSVMESAAVCDKCILGGATFNVTKLCDGKPCDEDTTTCSSRDGGFDCSCLDTYIKTNFSDRICVACPSGQKAVDSSFCKDCEFGYSGLNCTEYWKLALVIVGSVLGGLLLITLILLPVLTLRSPKKSTEKSKHEDIGKPYVSHFPAKAPLTNGNGSFANSQVSSYHGSGFESAGVPRIPRATANSNWDSRTNLEMTPSNSRQNLVPVGSNSLYEDEDDMNSYTRPPQSNLYAPARPRSNPYAQSRPQNNPYAPNQGQNNPYYLQNNEKW